MSELVKPKDKMDSPNSEDHEEAEEDVELGAAAAGRSRHLSVHSLNPLPNPADDKKKKKKKKSKKKKLEQTDPPRVGLSKFYPDGIYPEGEIQTYKNECVLTTADVLSGALIFDGTVMHGERPRKRNATMKRWRTRIQRRHIKASGEQQRSIDLFEDMLGNS